MRALKYYQENSLNRSSEETHRLVEVLIVVFVRMVTQLVQKDVTFAKRIAKIAAEKNAASPGNHRLAIKQPTPGFSGGVPIGEPGIFYTSAGFNS